MKVTTKTAEEMQRLAAEWADQLIDARIVLLQGELGAGKTTFTQGVAKALGVERPVKSPTYMLVNLHPVKHEKIDQLVHVDLYRLGTVDATELKQIGLDDLLEDKRSLVMIEWPERLEKPIDGLTLAFTVNGDTHTVEQKTAR